MKWMLLVLFCGVLGGISQLIFKSYVNPLQIFKLGIGFALYGIAFLLYLWALRHLDVSVAYPLIAVSYIIVAILSTVVLKESWSISKTAGTVGLVACLWLIAR